MRGTCSTPAAARRTAGATAGPSGRAFRNYNPLTSSTRASRSRRPQAASPSVDSLSSPICEKGERLRAWVESQGGYVNPNLVVLTTASCGTRGVTAVAPIGIEVITSEPLVLVPERLYMTTITAKERFNALPNIFISDLDPAMQLALLLAVERQAGEASFWAPYIDALPERPPCAWCMGPAEVRQTSGVLREVLPDLDIAAEVLKVQRQIQSECEIVADGMGRQLGVTAADLFWAKGQVLSRCFGSEELGLAPYIDLINHRDRAGAPDAIEVHDDVMVFVSSSLMAVGVPLAAGDELFINYIHSSKPFTTYLSFGFVPPALLGQRT